MVAGIGMVRGQPEPAPSPEAAAKAPEPTEREVRAEAHRKLRFDYAESAEYNPYATEPRECRQRGGELLEKDDFAAAIAEADKGLETDRFNIDLLMIKAAAQRGAGQEEQADETRRLWMALVDSILQHGDGRSFETAFDVISVAEEYSLLRIMRLEPVDQRLMSNDGHQFDVFTVQLPKSEQTVQLYFNVDRPMGWMNRRIGSSAGEAK